MEFIKHLSPAQILLSVEARDKWDVIDRMLDAILEHPICKRQSEYVLEHIREFVVQREHDSATYMGNEIALPHARIKNFRGAAICIAVLKNAIRWEDGEASVKVVFMVLASEENPTVILKTMSALAQLLTDEETKQRFFTETNPEALYEYLSAKHVDLDISILARDIMQTRYPSVQPDTPLRQVTHKMFVHRVEAIAVVDEDDKFHGEITCEILLKRGVPDFFNQLMSVSFIKDFDPFEKYFEVEAQSTARDAANTECAVTHEKATLMEIIYLLAVKKYQKVYVVKDGKLSGTIARTRVLDQILNL